MSVSIRIRKSRTGPAAHQPAGGLARRAALAATLAAATALTSAPVASATAATTQATALTPGAQTQTVTLPTGERVLVGGSSGKTTYTLAGLAGSANAYASYQIGSDHYVVPSEAEPYLGSVLSPALFDVTQLLRTGSGAAAHVQVSLTFVAGVTPSAPPGVTLTSTSGSTAQGYLTASSGADLAAGLRAAIGADVAAGLPAGSGTLFGGLTSMGPAAALVTAPAAVHPNYVLHTLQIDGTDINGAPLNTLAVLMNADSATEERADVFLEDGIARIEVPAGDYGIMAESFDFTAQGVPTASRTIVIDDFTVPDTAGATTTIQLEESAATSSISATTPRPATMQSSTVTWDREDPTGDGESFAVTSVGDVPTYVSPQPAAPLVGSLHFQVQLGYAGPANGPQYRYDAFYDTPAIPADESHVLQPRQLATVQQDFYGDPAAGANGTYLMTDALDANSGGFVILFPTALYSGPFTEYVAAASGTQWEQGAESPSAVLFGDVRTFDAGHSYRIDWLRGPLAANLGQYTGASPFNPSCSACASDGAMLLAYNPFGDSEPDHVGFGFAQNVDDAVYVDGTEVFDQAEADQVILTGVPSGTSTVREVYDTDFAGDSQVSQSAATHTDLTFRYTPNTDASDTLPSSYICDYSDTVTTPCQVLPVMTLSYRLAVDQENTSASKVQVLALTVGHVTYDGFGSHAPITSAHVSVSFDGGKSWVPALVAGLGGHYVALWQNPASAAGSSPELRVTATDAAGGSISQTITAAYTVAAQLK
jgi:hypothetical protein